MTWYMVVADLKIQHTIVPRYLVTGPFDSRANAEKWIAKMRPRLSYGNKLYVV